MARALPTLGKEIFQRIEAAWAKLQPDWGRKRLLVVRLNAQLHDTARADQGNRLSLPSRRSSPSATRSSPRRTKRCSSASWAGDREPPRLVMMAEYSLASEAGDFRQARDPQKWIPAHLAKSSTRAACASSCTGSEARSRCRARVTARKTRPLPTHSGRSFPNASPKWMDRFPQARAMWVLDEHRYGLLPVIRRVWSDAGPGPCALSTTYQWGYLMRNSNSTARTTRNCSSPPQSIRTSTRFSCGKSKKRSGLLQVVIRDKPDFSCGPATARLPTNIRLLPLAPYSPELNPVEGFGGLLKGPTANRLYRNLKRLEDHLIAVPKAGSRRTRSTR